jgi:Uma2 family endonuclease
VREYWLIDPKAQTVEAFFRERGQYRLVGRWRRGERAKSRLLEGFTVHVKELFGQP